MRGRVAQGILDVDVRLTTAWACVCGKHYVEGMQKESQSACVLDTNEFERALLDAICTPVHTLHNRQSQVLRFPRR